MNIEELLKDNTLKPKEKTQQLADWILSGELPLDELIHLAEKSKDSPKATCIEAIEYATKTRPSIANEMVIDFVFSNLNSKAPRVIWESAKVIGNSIHLHPQQTEKAIKRLLPITEHSGTVVRWSAAYALGEIVKQKTDASASLRSKLEVIMSREEKNSIKKIYQKALKTIN